MGGGQAGAGDGAGGGGVETGSLDIVFLVVINEVTFCEPNCLKLSLNLRSQYGLGLSIFWKI